MLTISEASFLPGLKRGFSLFLACVFLLDPAYASVFQPRQLTSPKSVSHALSCRIDEEAIIFPALWVLQVLGRIPGRLLHRLRVKNRPSFDSLITEDTVIRFFPPDPKVPSRETRDPDVSRALPLLQNESHVVFLGSDKADGERVAEETATRWARGEVQGQSLKPTAFLRIDMRRFIAEFQIQPITEWNSVLRKIREADGSLGLLLIHLDAALNDPVMSEPVIQTLRNPRMAVLGSSDFSGYRVLERTPPIAKQIPFVVTTPPVQSEKKVLIIGASSYLGETLYRSFKANYASVLGTAYSKSEYETLDVQDPQSVSTYLKAHHPDVIIYSAVEANAEKAEADKPRAYRINAGIVDTIADHFQGKFVYISTEYVFDGKHETGPYTSLSPTNPVNYYGVTKVEGEERALARFTSPIILRLGVLYGYNHPDDRLTTAKLVLNSLLSGDALSMDHDQIKRPLLLDDASQSLIRLLGHDASGIFQLNGRQAVTKYQWAKTIHDVLAGMAPLPRFPIRPSHVPPSAPRPLNTDMVSVDAPQDLVSGTRFYLQNAGVVWPLIQRALDAVRVKTGDSFSNSDRKLSTINLDGEQWEIRAAETPASAYHGVLAAIDPIDKLTLEKRDLNSMIAFLDNMQDPSVTVVYHSPPAGAQPHEKQVQFLTLDSGEDVSQRAMRVSAVDRPIVSEALWKIVNALQRQKIPFRVTVYRNSSGRYEGAVFPRDVIQPSSEPPTPSHRPTALWQTGLVALIGWAGVGLSYFGTRALGTWAGYPSSARIVGGLLSLALSSPALFYSFQWGTIAFARWKAYRIRAGKKTGPDANVLEAFRIRLEMQWGHPFLPAYRSSHIAYLSALTRGIGAIHVELLAFYLLPHFIRERIVGREIDQLNGHTEVAAFWRGAWRWLPALVGRFMRIRPESFSPRFLNPNLNSVPTHGLGRISLGFQSGESNLYPDAKDLPQVLLLPEPFFDNGQCLVAFTALLERHGLSDPKRPIDVLGTVEQWDRLRPYLETSMLFDFNKLKDLPSPTRENLQKELLLLAPRMPSEQAPQTRGRRIELNNLVQFWPLDTRHPWEHNGVVIALERPGIYRIEEGDQVTKLGEVRTQPLEVDFPRVRPVERVPEFGVTFLGTNAGYDPRGLSTNYILWAGTRGVLVDIGPYTLPLLKKLQIPLNKVTDVFITHAHEAHDAGLAGLLQEKLRRGEHVNLITSKIIQQSLTIQLEALLGPHEAHLLLDSSINWTLLEPGVPVRLGSQTALVCQYALHTMPSLMGRLTYKEKTIAFSGDHLYEPWRYARWEAGDIPDEVQEDMDALHVPAPYALDPARRKVIEYFLLDGPPDLLIHDFGSPVGTEGSHTSLTAFGNIPTEIRLRTYGVHAHSLPPGLGIRLAYPGLTLDVTPRSRETLSAETTADISQRAREGVTPDQFNEIKGEIILMKPGDIPYLPSPQKEGLSELEFKGQTEKYAYGISAGGLGLGARGLTQPNLSLLLPDLDERPHPLLGWKLGNVRHASARTGPHIPVYIMTSPFNDQSTREMVRAKRNYGFPKGDLRLFSQINQERVVPGKDFLKQYEASRLEEMNRQRANGFLTEDEYQSKTEALREGIAQEMSHPGSVLTMPDGTVSMNPAGHWEFLREMLIRGDLGRLHREGIELLYHSNLTNAAATLDQTFDALRGEFAAARQRAAASNAPIPILQFELAKNQEDPGSYPAFVRTSSGIHRRLIKDSALRASGLDPSSASFVNTGNCLMYIPGLLQFFKLPSDYDQHMSPPEIAAWIDHLYQPRPELSVIEESSVIPSVLVKKPVTYVAFQVERSLDSFTSVVPWVGIFVDRDQRFIPLQKEEQILPAEMLLTRALKGKVDVSFDRRPMRVDPHELESLSQHPMVFFPNLINYSWGGNWIPRFKGMGFQDNLVAESWEISTHPRSPSRLGLSQGKSIELPELLRLPGMDQHILGSQVVHQFGSRVPVIVKILDSRLDLSVQVHPSDETALRLGEKDPGKEEDFLIWGVQEGAKVYLGLKDGVDEATYRHASQSGVDLRDYMNAVEVKPGEFYRVPPGIVHAWGGGLQMVEIARDSDLTYRLYDYHRKERNRPLHPEKGLEAINFKAPTGDALVQYLRRAWIPTADPQVDEVRPDPSLKVERIRVSDSLSFSDKTSSDVFQILMVLSGHVQIESRDHYLTDLREGYSVLLPASMGEYTLRTIGSLTAQVLRIQPLPLGQQIPVHIGISAGGTKMAVGVTDSAGIIAQGPPFYWRPVLEARGQLDPHGFVQLMVEQTMEMLSRFSISRENVQKVGVAWPGPVLTDKGTVSATFIPGFTDYPLAAELQSAMTQRIGHSIPVMVILDVVAGLLGERKFKEGALRAYSNGMVLNIGTGIAAGFLHNGRPVESAHYALSEGYSIEIESGLGQVGRHLIRRADGTWEYRPTAHGEVPNLGDGENRWTLWDGGPALAKRFIQQCLEQFGENDSAYLGRRVGDLHINPLSRDENIEKFIIAMITAKANIGDSFARDFIIQIGREVGGALRAIAEAYPEEHYLDRVVLVGGVGENFGRDVDVDDKGENLFIRTIRETSGIHSLVYGSKGLHLEFLAFAPPVTVEEALKPLQYRPDREMLYSVMQKLSIMSSEMESRVLTLHVLSPIGAHKTETMTIPFEVLRKHADVLASYVAARLNVWGELEGIESVWITSDAPQDDLTKLLMETESLISREYGGTLGRANHGRPISWPRRPPEIGNQMPTPERFPAVSYDQGTAIGIDIGGVNINLIGIRDGQIVDKSSIYKSSVGGPRLGESIEEAVLRMSLHMGISANQLWGSPIIMSVPGTIDPDGHIVSLPNLETTFPGSVKSLEELRSRHPTIEFENSGNVMGSYFVRTQSLSGTVVLNTIGTGLGLAIIHQGRLQEGLAEAHMRIDFSKNAPRDVCGTLGCLEPLANTQFITKRAIEIMQMQGVEDKIPTPRSSADVNLWLNSSDPRRQAIAQQLYSELGSHLANLYTEVARWLKVQQMTLILVGAPSRGRKYIINGIQDAIRRRNLDLRLNFVFPLKSNETHRISIASAPSSWIGSIGAAILGLSAQQRSQNPSPSTSHPIAGRRFA